MCDGARGSRSVHRVAYTAFCETLMRYLIVPGLAIALTMALHSSVQGWGWRSTEPQAQPKPRGKAPQRTDPEKKEEAPMQPSVVGRWLQKETLRLIEFKERGEF